MNAPNAIPTTYRDYRFRSRLEATWAAMFDLLEWPWLYEPLDLNGYIPDFLLTFPKEPLLIEVKPALYYEDLCQYSGKIERSGWNKEYMIVGAGPLNPGDYYNTIGAISERGFYPQFDDERNEVDHNDVVVFWLSEAILFKCLMCKHYSVLHNDGSWWCRRCGGYSGNDHIDWIEDEHVKKLWAQAHTQTQYQHKRAR